MSDARQPGKPSSKILVVEDEEPIRELVATALRFRGYEVTEAASGAEAITAARNIRPELIVLDVMLPDIDGFAICR
ncbi:MAG: response regulator, partial [Chloroflexota bacterium]